MTTARSVAELFEELSELFEEDLPCEIPDHGVDQMNHTAEEAGSWYITAKCKKCNFGGTVLTCNSFRNSVVKELDTGFTLCMRCKLYSPNNEFVTSMVYRG